MARTQAQKNAADDVVAFVTRIGAEMAGTATRPRKGGVAAFTLKGVTKFGGPRGGMSAHDQDAFTLAVRKRLFKYHRGILVGQEWKGSDLTLLLAAKPLDANIRKNAAEPPSAQ